MANMAARFFEKKLENWGDLDGVGVPGQATKLVL